MINNFAHSIFFSCKTVQVNNIKDIFLKIGIERRMAQKLERSIHEAQVTGLILISGHVIHTTFIDE